MTVSYTLKVADARFAGFSKLLLRWKGSIYKLLYKELIVFISLYSVFSVTYRYFLTPAQKIVFEKVATYCDKQTSLIPMSFVLGFYVTLIINRWWNQYTNIPLPDRLMCVVSGNVHGADEKGRILRRTLIRYANLSAVLILRSISTRIRKRFPSIEHVVEAGFMTHDELEKFESLYSDFNKYWIPCVWFTNLAAQARREGRIRDDVALRLLMDELNLHRAKCSLLFHYDWISIPLVYTQVVTIAVYSFFACCLIGRQFLEPKPGHEDDKIDIYVPVFTLLQFFFYAGWLKVAEQIINPFGEDDDDFETNKLIDRNLQVSFLSVDDMYLNLPALEKDKYWNNTAPQPPYTIATASETHKPSFLGSTFDMHMIDSQVQHESEMELKVHTPLFNRFLNVAASPAISLRNFGWGNKPNSLQGSSSNCQLNESDLVIHMKEEESEREDQDRPTEPSLGTILNSSDHQN
ncbi:bestrophin-4 [Rhinoraja longicauda]